MENSLYEGLIPQLAQNNRYQPENQKPTLKQMLALSNNGHDKDLSKQKPLEQLAKEYRGPKLNFNRITNYKGVA